MASLIIEMAMVNPVGKMKWVNQSPPSSVLNEEWVQLRNIGTQEVSLNNIKLMHWTYSGKTADTAQNVEILTLSGSLNRGTSLRIHSGKGKAFIDPKTQIIHIFCNAVSGQFNYQIIQPDCITLSVGGKSIDFARYDPPIPEGKRLRRGSNIGSNTLSL
ncbi:MAG: hypothetical protein P9L92_10680 [Candidatus Electryonea clarkiae]|nr:hypothetical protein [Candidatus Electryonea clarkiae]MDP8288550.1 hypothetical protein [Candidatus Electryonea clarkiae]